MTLAGVPELPSAECPTCQHPSVWVKPDGTFARHMDTEKRTCPSSRQPAPTTEETT